jgi:hypothetical protein
LKNAEEFSQERITELESKVRDLEMTVGRLEA